MWRYRAEEHGPDVVGFRAQGLVDPLVQVPEAPLVAGPRGRAIALEVALRRHGRRRHGSREETKKLSLALDPGLSSSPPPSLRSQQLSHRCASS